MEITVVAIHNILRWIILILLLFSLITALSGWFGKKVFRPADKKLWLVTMIFNHLNFLLGAYLLYQFYNTIDPGVNIMKEKGVRFFLVEHPLLMLLAIILITIGHGVAKKPIADIAKYKRASLCFLIALVLILAAVPWPFREIVGRAYWPM